MDDDQDKLNRFKDAFERGQEGQVSNYEVWLQDQGFDPEKVDPRYLSKHLRQNIGKAVNHDEELEEVAEYAGFFSRRTTVHHLPIIGVSGIGKTQFLKTVADLLERLEPGIEQRSLNAEKFSEAGEEDERIFEIRDDLRGLEKVVLLVDNCSWERPESLVESFRVIESVADDALILTAWNPEDWKHHRHEVEDVLPASTEIHLEPFTEDESKKAVSRIFEIIADDGRKVPEAFLQRIHQHSSGIPGVFTELSLNSLRETFLKDLELGDVEAVESAAGKMNLVDTEQTVYGLSDTKLTILRHMLLWNHRKGIRPSQLVDLLDRDKSTVSYHLKDLTEAGLVESEKSGRSAYYRVKDPVKPFVQIRINQNGEHHG